MEILLTLADLIEAAIISLTFESCSRVHIELSDKALQIVMLEIAGDNYSARRRPRQGMD